MYSDKGLVREPKRYRRHGGPTIGPVPTVIGILRLILLDELKEAHMIEEDLHILFPMRVVGAYSVPRWLTTTFLPDRLAHRLYRP